MMPSVSKKTCQPGFVSLRGLSSESSYDDASLSSVVGGGEDEVLSPRGDDMDADLIAMITEM